MKYEHEFRIEYFVTVIFIVLAVLSIKQVGFTGVKEAIFTSITIIYVPFAYFGSRMCRKLFYQVLRGYGKYED